MAAKSTKQKSNKTYLKTRLTKVNRILGKLEGEFEKALRGVIIKGERSSHDLRKNFDEVLEWLKNGNIYAIASGTKESLEAEVSRLKKETLERMRELETLNPQQFYGDIKQGLHDFIAKVQENPVVGNVRAQAEKSRDQVFEVLNIADRKQFNQVAHKVGRLEKRVQALSKRAA